MSTTIYSGSCLCGHVRISVRGPLRELAYCHCQSCRRASGAPVVAWGTVDREHFALVEGSLETVQSSPNVQRGFCGDCGSSMTYARADLANEIDIALAVLDDPPAPERHIWVSDGLAWLSIDDGLPQFAEFSHSTD